MNKNQIKKELNKFIEERTITKYAPSEMKFIRFLPHEWEELIERLFEC